VVTYRLFALTLLLSLPLPVADRIETAFLQNSPAELRDLLTAGAAIPVSLPEPLSISDQLSPDQTVLVFARIFATFKTTEFSTDPRVSARPGAAGGILRARWSFRNERTGLQYPLRIYFFFVPESPPRAPGDRSPVMTFKIVEIRAEKL
jgi:hypothetical protein